MTRWHIQRVTNFDMFDRHSADEVKDSFEFDNCALMQYFNRLEADNELWAKIDVLKLFICCHSSDSSHRSVDASQIRSLLKISCSARRCSHRALCECIHILTYWLFHHSSQSIRMTPSLPNLLHACARALRSFSHCVSRSRSLVAHNSRLSLAPLIIRLAKLHSSSTIAFYSSRYTRSALFIWNSVRILRSLWALRRKRDDSSFIQSFGKCQRRNCLLIFPFRFLREPRCMPLWVQKKKKKRI